MRFQIVYTAAFSLLLLAGCSKSSLSSGESPITSEKRMLNLGDINEGDKKSGSVSLYNSGKSAVRIQSVTASCGCTSAKVQPEIIEPGAAGKLLVELDSRGRKNQFESTITVNWTQITGGKKGSFSILARGNALFSAAVSPIRIDFGDVYPPNTVDGRDIVFGRGTQKVPFSDLEVSTSANGVTATIQKLNDDKWTISTALNLEKLKAGPFHASLNISMRSPEGVELLKREIPITAEVRGPISARPKTLYLGVLQSGETKTGRIFLEGAPETLVKLKQLRVEPYVDFIRFKAPQLLDQTSGVTSIEYEVSTKGRTGNTSGEITVEFEDKNMAQLSIPYISFVKEADSSKN
jgi:hypothetical protein